MKYYNKYNFNDKFCRFLNIDSNTKYNIDFIKSKFIKSIIEDNNNLIKQKLKNLIKNTQSINNNDIHYHNNLINKINNKTIFYNHKNYEIYSIIKLFIEHNDKINHYNLYFKNLGNNIECITI